MGRRLRSAIYGGEAGSAAGAAATSAPRPLSPGARQEGSRPPTGSGDRSGSAAVLPSRDGQHRVSDAPPKRPSHPTRDGSAMAGGEAEASGEAGPSASLPWTPLSDVGQGPFAADSALAHVRRRAPGRHRVPAAGAEEAGTTPWSDTDAAAAARRGAVASPRALSSTPRLSAPSSASESSSAAELSAAQELVDPSRSVRSAAGGEQAVAGARRRASLRATGTGAPPGRGGAGGSGRFAAAGSLRVSAPRLGACRPGSPLAVEQRPPGLGNPAGAGTQGGQVPRLALQSRSLSSKGPLRPDAAILSALPRRTPGTGLAVGRASSWGAAGGGALGGAGSHASAGWAPAAGASQGGPSTAAAVAALSLNGTSSLRSARGRAPPQSAAAGGAPLRESVLAQEQLASPAVAAAEWSTLPRLAVPAYAAAAAVPSATRAALAAGAAASRTAGAGSGVRPAAAPGALSEAAHSPLALPPGRVSPSVVSALPSWVLSRAPGRAGGGEHPSGASTDRRAEPARVSRVPRRSQGGALPERSPGAPRRPQGGQSGAHSTAVGGRGRTVAVRRALSQSRAQAGRMRARTGSAGRASRAAPDSLVGVMATRLNKQ